MNRRGAGPMDASLFGRGAGEGLGVHICTGPVYVRGAEPGDVLEVRIVDVTPRPCANPQFKGKAFGSNAAAWWGFHYKDLLTEPKQREVITIYEVDASGERNWAKAVYNFRWTPQTDPFGVVHKTIDYPGVPVDHSTIKENYDILKGMRIPVRPHFGVLGLAPKEADIVDSIPPELFRRQHRQLAHRQGRHDVLPGGGRRRAVLGRRPARVAGRLRTVRHRHRMLADRHLPVHPAQEGRSASARALEDLDYPMLETAGRLAHARLQLRQLSRRTWAPRRSRRSTRSPRSISPCATPSARCGIS